MNYSEPKIKKQKNPWSFDISIFKDWRKEDEVVKLTKIFIQD